MNLDQLHKKLITVARASQPDARVPYAFEKRIMAQLAAAPIDWLGAWAAALWRAAVPCVALVAVAGAVSLWNNHQNSQPDFSQAFDKAVYASVDLPDETW